MDDLNLNPQLVSNNSPLTNTGVTTAMDFDSQTERNSVNTAHIRNFSFSQGTGGTLTLTEGMSIVNSAGTTVIDATGLVSANNFNIVGTLGTGVTLLSCGSSSAWQDASGTTTVVLTRQARILTLYTSMLMQYTTGTYSYKGVNMYLGLNIDGTLLPDSGFGWGIGMRGELSKSTDGTFNDSQPHLVSPTYLTTLDAGTHTFKIQGKFDTDYDPTGQVEFYYQNLVNIVLGV